MTPERIMDTKGLLKRTCFVCSRVLKEHTEEEVRACLDRVDRMLKPAQPRDNWPFTDPDFEPLPEEDGNADPCSCGSPHSAGVEHFATRPCRDEFGNLPKADVDAGTAPQKRCCGCSCSVCERGHHTGKLPHTKACGDLVLGYTEAVPDVTDGGASQNHLVKGAEGSLEPSSAPAPSDELERRLRQAETVIRKVRKIARHGNDIWQLADNYLNTGRFTDGI